MIDNRKILAIIPARSGSKGLPKKNIKELCGKPLIAWTIEEAIKSKYIDEIMVSTDTNEIAKIGLEFGAKIPFIRPPKLASDTAKAIEYILHTINYYDNHYEIIILLQPTSPLRSVIDIDAAISMLVKDKIRAVVSVCELEHPLAWTGTLPKNLSMQHFTKEEDENTNRQELEKYYRYNGAIYIAEIEYIIKENGFIGDETYAYKMTQENSIDIDTLIDFMLAEVILKERLNERNK